MSQYELLRTFGGGKVGPSAYEIYVDVQIAAGQPVLTKEEWVAREGGSYDDTAVRQRLGALEEKQLPAGQSGQVVGFDNAGKPIAITPPAPTWSTLIGKPPTFPPAPHQHQISDVTGLQVALDSKAETAAILTTEQVQDLVAAMFQGGTHINASVSYNDASGTLSITASGGGGPQLDQEAVEDFVGGLVTEGTGISVVYDDAGNVLRVSLSGESFTTALRTKLDALPSSFKTIGGQSIGGSGDIALPDAYDDLELRALIAQLTERVDDLARSTENRPPNSSPIPTQMLTLGVEFAADFQGYFSDPDGDELEALPVVGSLPPGITQNGFGFSGTPTQAGNFSVSLPVVDARDAQTVRTIAWQVATVAGEVMKLSPAPGGYTLQNPDTFPEITLTATMSGYTLEIV